MHLALAVAILLAAQDDVRTRMERGLGLLQAGQVEQARALFDSIVAEAPDHGPARLQLGRLAVEAAEWETAREHLEIAVASNPRRPQLAQHLLGVSLQALDDRDGARRAYGRALEIAPTFLPPRTRLAEMDLEDGDLWSALAHYRAGAAAQPDANHLHAAIANVARRMHATELARCAVDRALEAEPASGSLHYLSAVIEEEAGAVDEAIRLAQAALERGFDDAAVYVTLGNLYHEKMRLADAVDAFATALSLDAGVAESLASFALASLTTAEFRELRPELERFAAENPGSVNTLHALPKIVVPERETPGSTASI